MRIAAAAFFALLAAAPAGAADWYRVAASNSGVHYVDIEQISREGDTAVAPELAVWLQPSPSGVVRAVTRLEVDCRDLSYRYRAHTFYLQSGRSDSFEGDGVRREPARGSSIEAIAGFVCGNRGEAERLVGVTPEQDAAQLIAAAAGNGAQ